LERLALARTEGIELRNEGFAVVNEDEREQWQARYEVWRQDALRTAERVAKHEASGLVTIGHFLDEDWMVVVRGNVPYQGSDHLRQLAFLTSDCRRLDEIRRRNS
jgi:hypothetical protein